jgi:hypothetical protein
MPIYIDLREKKGSGFWSSGIQDLCLIPLQPKKVKEAGGKWSKTTITWKIPCKTFGRKPWID